MKSNWEANSSGGFNKLIYSGPGYLGIVKIGIKTTEQGDSVVTEPDFRIAFQNDEGFQTRYFQYGDLETSILAVESFFNFSEIEKKEKFEELRNAKRGYDHNWISRNWEESHCRGESWNLH